MFPRHSLRTNRSYPCVEGSGDLAGGDPSFPRRLSLSLRVAHPLVLKSLKNVAPVRTFPALSTLCVLHPLISLPLLRRWGDKRPHWCPGLIWFLLAFPLSSPLRVKSQFVRCLQLPTHHEPNTGSSHEVESLRRLCIPLLSLLCTPKSISVALRYAGEGGGPPFHFSAFHYRIRWGAFDREPALW